MAGIYFTPDYEVAADWAYCNSIEEGDNPTVMVVHLEMRNPYSMEGIESHVISLERRDELIAMGYDGVIGHSNGQPFEYVAFDPKQVHITSVDRSPDLPAAFRR